MSKPLCVHCTEADPDTGPRRAIAITQDLEGEIAYVHANCKVAYEESKQRKLQELTTTERKYLKDKGKQEFEESIAYQTKPPSAREMMDEIKGIHDKVDEILKLLEKPAKKKVAKKP